MKKSAHNFYCKFSVILFVSMLTGCDTEKIIVCNNLGYKNAIFEHERDNIEIVFDLKDMFSYTRSKGSQSNISHFGQSIKNCSNKQYYCIDGDISFSLPKSKNKHKWIYNKYKCKINSIDKIVFYIDCESLNKSRSTRTLLNRDGDILSFTSTAGGTGSTYNIKLGTEFSICFAEKT